MRLLDRVTAPRLAWRARTAAHRPSVAVPLDLLFAGSRTEPRRPKVLAGEGGRVVVFAVGIAVEKAWMMGAAHKLT